MLLFIKDYLLNGFSTYVDTFYYKNKLWGILVEFNVSWEPKYYTYNLKADYVT